MVAVALVAGLYLYFRLDDEIRRQVEQRLASHYTHLSLRVGGARFEPERGIYISKLDVLEPQQGSTPQSLLSVDELFLAGKIRVEDLVKGQPPIDRIVVRRPRLRAVRRSDGTWNIRTLLPLPKFSDQHPALAIEDATLILEQSGDRHYEPLTIRGVDLTIMPLESHGPGGAHSCACKIQGTVSGLPAKELKFEGQLDPADGSLDLTATIAGLEISPDLLATLPGFPADDFADTKVSGRADIGLRVTRGAGANAPLDWSATMKVDRGQLNHPLLPNPVTDVVLSLSAAPHRLTIEKFGGRCGTADVVLACDRHGWNLSSPMGLAVRIVGLPLDERIEAALPAPLARCWKRFRPAGVVDAELQVAYDGQHWRPQLTAECRGVSLTDVDKFPYVLEQATGTVTYTPASATAADQFHLSLSAVGGGRPVHIEARLSQLTPGANQSARKSAAGASAKYAEGAAPHPVGWVEIGGTDIPLHDRLLAAIPDKGRRVVQSLRAQGAFDFRWRAEWTDPLQPLAEVLMAVTLKDCSIQFEKFSYPVHHVHGVLTARNWNWTWQDMQGRGGNDSTVVFCSGSATNVGDGCRVDMLFQAQNVPLDENLRQALLTPMAQRAWMELRPQGRVDFAAQIVHEPGHSAPAIAVTLRPCDGSVSIEPQGFPYRLEQIGGTVTYQADRVELQNVVAHHDRVTYSAKSGSWQPTPGGGWQLTLNGFNSDGLTIHRDLLAALPARLQKTIERLQPSGIFELSNSSLLLAKESGSERIASAWDINLVCHQASLQCGMPFENCWGEIRLVGQDNGRNSYTSGELAIDSLTFKDVQLTNIRGPLWVDRSLCLLGQPATQKLGQPLRRITADAYGGSLAGDARIEHDGNPRYQMEVSLGGADLGRFASERLGGPKELTGTVAGKLSLTGTGQSIHALNGTGELHVVDAHIYELPVLVSLLKVLRNRTPNSTAFDRCDTQFVIQGEHVHFQQLNLLGDAVSLYGRGETNFDRKLNLVFYSLVGPADLPIPLWKTIAGQVSQQGLQLKVTGTWERPETQKDVLPSVNQVIQEIQNGIQAGAATMTPPAAARSDSQPVRR